MPEDHAPLPEPDLMPPPFAEGLDDWSAGDGTPGSPTYDRIINARIARNDPDLGTCLEIRKVDDVQRVRYMAEMPVRPGGCLEVSIRVAAARGPLPGIRIAATPGGKGGCPVPGLPTFAGLVRLERPGKVEHLRAVIGPLDLRGIDLVWGEEVLYAHVGFDITGPDGSVVRVGDLSVRDVSRDFCLPARILPGFTAADL